MSVKVLVSVSRDRAEFVGMMLYYYIRLHTGTHVNVVLLI